MIVMESWFKVTEWPILGKVPLAGADYWVVTALGLVLVQSTAPGAWPTK